VTALGMGQGKLRNHSRTGLPYWTPVYLKARWNGSFRMKIHLL